MELSGINILKKVIFIYNMAEEVKENNEVKVKKSFDKEYHNKMRQCEICNGSFSYNTKFRHDNTLKHILCMKDKEIESKNKEITDLKTVMNIKEDINIAQVIDVIQILKKDTDFKNK
jgi:hypothetical protein